MNALDVVKYGHLTLLGTLEGVPAGAWEEPGVCGGWSVKDVVAHLASYEAVLVEILTELAGDGPTPTLDRFREQGAAFNDAEVARRAGRAAAETVEELNGAHARASALLARVPVAERSRVGALPWYGAEYALDDLLVYLFYGHKREHAAQIAVFRDQTSG